MLITQMIAQILNVTVSNLRDWQTYFFLIATAAITVSINFTYLYTMSKGNFLNKWSIFIANKWYFKPFGGCYNCTAFWLGLLIYLMVFSCKMDYIIPVIAGCVSLFVNYKYSPG